MRRLFLVACVAAACWLTPSLGFCVITHYNVDKQTLPNGPVELITTAAPTFDSGLNQWTFSFGAQNNFITTQTDVRFLLQFVFDGTEAFAFNDATDVWSNTGATKTMSFPGLGDFPMSDTDAPLSWIKPQGTGTLLATDGVPQKVIGDIAPFSMVPFTILVQLNTAYVPFSVVGSFVSAPLPDGGPNLPEPSSFALLGLGAAGVLVLRRRIRGPR